MPKRTQIQSSFSTESSLGKTGETETAQIDTRISLETPELPPSADDGGSIITIRFQSEAGKSTWLDQFTMMTDTHINLFISNTPSPCIAEPKVETQEAEGRKHTEWTFKPALPEEASTLGMLTLAWLAKLIHWEFININSAKKLVTDHPIMPCPFKAGLLMDAAVRRLKNEPYTSPLELTRSKHGRDADIDSDYTPYKRHCAGRGRPEEGDAAAIAAAPEHKNTGSFRAS